MSWYLRVESTTPEAMGELSREATRARAHATDSEADEINAAVAYAADAWRALPPGIEVSLVAGSYCPAEGRRSEWRSLHANPPRATKRAPA